MQEPPPLIYDPEILCNTYNDTLDDRLADVLRSYSLPTAPAEFSVMDPAVAPALPDETIPCDPLARRNLLRLRRRLFAAPRFVAPAIRAHDVAALRERARDFSGMIPVRVCTPTLPGVFRGTVIDGSLFPGDAIATLRTQPQLASVFDHIGIDVDTATLQLRVTRTNETIPPQCPIGAYPAALADLRADGMVTFSVTPTPPDFGRAPVYIDNVAALAEAGAPPHVCAAASERAAQVAAFARIEHDRFTDGGERALLPPMPRLSELPIGHSLCIAWEGIEGLSTCVTAETLDRIGCTPAYHIMCHERQVHAAQILAVDPEYQPPPLPTPGEAALRLGVRLGLTAMLLYGRAPLAAPEQTELADITDPLAGAGDGMKFCYSARDMPEEATLLVALTAYPPAPAAPAPDPHAAYQDRTSLAAKDGWSRRDIARDNLPGFDEAGCAVMGWALVPVADRCGVVTVGRRRVGLWPDSPERRMGVGQTNVCQKEGTTTITLSIMPELEETGGRHWRCGDAEPSDELLARVRGDVEDARTAHAEFIAALRTSTENTELSAPPPPSSDQLIASGAGKRGVSVDTALAHVMETFQSEGAAGRYDPVTNVAHSIPHDNPHSEAYACIARAISAGAGRPSFDDAHVLWSYRHTLASVPAALPAVLAAMPINQLAARREFRALVAAWQPPSVGEIWLPMLGPDCPDMHVRALVVRAIDELLFDADIRELLLPLTQAACADRVSDGPVAAWLLRRALLAPNAIAHELYWMLTTSTLSSEHPSATLHLLRHTLVFVGADPESCIIRRRFEAQHTLVDGLSRAARAAAAAPTLRRVAAGLEVLEEVRKGLFPRPDGEPLVLPTSSAHSVRDMVLDDVKVMASKKAPVRVTFLAADPNGADIQILFKAGDDLRQDQLVLQLLRIMERRWQRAGLDLRMSVYGCTATAADEGMLEVVRPAETTAHISMECGGGDSAVKGALAEEAISRWLKERNPGPDVYQRAVENFARSLAGYCVATHVLGVGDRHNDNLMVRADGCLFHIDFGWFLGRFKTKFGIKRERAPFVFTSDFAFALGGKRSGAYRLCSELMVAAYLLIRRDAVFYRSVLTLAMSAGLAQLSNMKDVDYVGNLLHTEMTPDKAATHFRGLIRESLNCVTTRIMNFIHLAARPKGQKAAQEAGSRVLLRYPSAFGFAKVYIAPFGAETPGLFILRHEHAKFIDREKRCKLVSDGEYALLFPKPTRGMRAALKATVGTTRRTDCWCSLNDRLLQVVVTTNNSPATVGVGRLGVEQDGVFTVLTPDMRCHMLTSAEVGNPPSFTSPYHPSEFLYPTRDGFQPVLFGIDGGLYVAERGRDSEHLEMSSITGTHRGKLITQQEYALALAPPAKPSTAPASGDIDTGLRMPGVAGTHDAITVVLIEGRLAMRDPETGRPVYLSPQMRRELYSIHEIGLTIDISR